MNLSRVFDDLRNLYSQKAYNNSSGLAPIPLRYFFELTYRCNLSCSYCYVGNDRNKNELTTEEWFNVIEQIPWYSIVTLVGGEPLIREDFIEILAKVSAKTFGKVNVVSNGVLLDEEIVDAFIKYKLLLLSISLDGFGNKHDVNRQQNGIFDKIISNLEEINSHKSRPMVDIKTIVLDNNLDDLPKLYKLCTEMSFNFFSLSFLRNNNFKQNSLLYDDFIPEFNKDYPVECYFDLEHFVDIYKELESMSKKSKVKIRFSPKFEYCKNPLEAIINFYSNSVDTPINEIYYPCKFPYSNMMISPCGDVYPCLSQRIGNVKDLTIKEIFNLPKYRCFRKNLKASKVFGACQMCCELRSKL